MELSRSSEPKEMCVHVSVFVSWEATKLWTKVAVYFYLPIVLSESPFPSLLLTVTVSLTPFQAGPPNSISHPGSRNKLGQLHSLSWNFFFFFFIYF